MTDKNDGVLDPLKCAVHCVREHRGPVRGAEMEQVVAKVAELLAAAESLEDGVSAKKMIRLYHATLAMRGDV